MSHSQPLALVWRYLGDAGPRHIVVAVFLEQIVRVDHPGEVGAMHKGLVLMRRAYRFGPWLVDFDQGKTDRIDSATDRIEFRLFDRQGISPHCRPTKERQQSPALDPQPGLLFGFQPSRQRQRHQAPRRFPTRSVPPPSPGSIGAHRAEFDPIEVFALVLAEHVVDQLLQVTGAGQCRAVDQIISIQLVQARGSPAGRACGLGSRPSPSAPSASSPARW